MAQHTAHASHVHWDDDEWEEFAAMLDRDNPDHGYMYSTNLAMLTCPILTSAGAKMRRPRQFFNLAGPRAKLIEAYARLREKKGVRGLPLSTSQPDAEEDEHRTRWVSSEWDDFAKVLHEDNPRDGFMDSPDLANLTIRQLNNAAAHMTRPRHFSSMGHAPKKLLEAYARLREKPTGSKPEQDTTPATGIRRAPPPSAPPSPLKLDEVGRPLAIQAEQRTKPAPASSPFAAVAWDRSEWLVVATEIDRMYPQSRYPEREHLTGLTTEDVAFAQRLLPHERQSRFIKVATFSTLVPALKEAFEDLRRQRRTTEMEHGVVAEAERQAKHVLTKAAIPPQTQSPAKPELPAPAAIPEAVAAPAQADPLQAALTLLLDHALGLLSVRLRPMIAELIDQALLAPAPAPATAAAPTVPPASTPAAPEAATPAVKVDKVDKVSRMRIGIVGSRNRAYVNELARDFPAIDFRWIDNVKEVDTIKNCNPVIVVTKFCSHTLRDQVLAKITKDQYIPIMGTLSDIRRTITGLLNGERASASHSVPALAA